LAEIHQTGELQSPLRLISRVPYPELTGPVEPNLSSGSMEVTLNSLICLWFDTGSHKTVTSSFAMQQKTWGFMTKISLANFLNGSTLSPRADFVRFDKESQNGLEDPEDRRSAGWHGNQHVCLRRPQVSRGVCFSIRLEVDLQT
jgi:hypothetical protein